MSEQKRYTAHEMREMAGHLIADICDTENECNEYRNAIGSFDLSDCELALRQAADAEEEREENEKVKWSADKSMKDERDKLIAENAQLKARLEVVVKMLEEEESRTSCDDCNTIFGDSETEKCECRFSEQHSIYEKILRAARGESENENK